MSIDIVLNHEQRRLQHLLNMEIRHIGASKLSNLALIVDQAKEWSRLIEDLTKPRVTASGKVHQLDLSLEAINLINQQYYCGKSPTLALLNYWSIMGRRRPTVRTLLSLLKECNLKRAEEYVCSSILGIASPPVKQANLQFRLKQISEEFRFENLNDLMSDLKTQCLRYSFRSLYEATNGFDDKIYSSNDKSGYKIGEGRFSTVFRAEIEGQVVAAKMLKSSCNEKYLVNEIDLIGKVRHKNILELLGISVDDFYICLLYPYMQNGSLFDCLDHGLQAQNLVHLEWRERVIMAKDIAEGIVYLHSFPEGSIIHRDIKSANIFISGDLTPKVGDFTLVRQNASAETSQATQTIIGTSVYMPPEAFRGDISAKFDTFSFGVVVLELLTGMKPFNEELQEDLLTYICDNLPSDEDGGDCQHKFLTENLDRRAGDWSMSCAIQLFDMALKATDIVKKTRPEMQNVLTRLETIADMIDNSVDGNQT